VIWCDNATLLTGTPWQYLKVPQPEWRKLQPVVLADVRLAFAPPQLAGT
jgi:type III restriction enzyme